MKVIYYDVSENEFGKIFKPLNVVGSDYYFGAEFDTSVLEEEYNDDIIDGIYKIEVEVKSERGFGGDYVERHEVETITDMGICLVCGKLIEGNINNFCEEHKKVTDSGLKELIRRNWIRKLSLEDEEVIELKMAKGEGIKLRQDEGLLSDNLCYVEVGSDAGVISMHNLRDFLLTELENQHRYV